MIFNNFSIRLIKKAYLCAVYGIVDKKRKLMHYAIIAAGEGSRLAKEGISVPKPRLPVEGVPVVERLIRIVARNKAESISVIVNTEMESVRLFLEQWLTDAVLQSLGIGKFRLIVESTPSSMHSFYCLSQVIDADMVCLTTVDTIFREHQFADFIRHAESLSDKDGCFAVTPFVEDEKPLYVETHGSRIVGFHDQGIFPYVSGGIYCLRTDVAFPILRQCIEEGMSRMRNFQRALISARLDIEAWVFPKIMDVDHASDLAKAACFLKPKVLFVTRAEEYSPGKIAHDRRIIELAYSRFSEQAPEVECKLVDEDQLPDTDIDSYQLVVGMERRQQSLQQIAKAKARAINSLQGIGTVSTSRSLTLSLLAKAGISVPDFATSPSPELLPCWVKAMRTNGHTADDVRYAATLAEAESAYSDFARQWVHEIVVMRHQRGTLLKAYAVADSRSQLLSLHWSCPQGEPCAQVDEPSLRASLVRISQVLDLQIFGVDYIVSESGEMKVIDVNDWPSYSVYQNEASEAIARAILIDLEA